MKNTDAKKQATQENKLLQLKRQKTIVLNKKHPPIPDELKEGDSILRYLPFTLRIY
ncbi:hypothetical protein KKH36_02135 [Patescibacteria group bacterium]|nr:hypothetical protein [Patescibacteria group bacterium]